MPDDTTILSLPLILPAQAQKHVTHNEALVALDLIVQLAVINRTLTTPPPLPTIGDRHIVAAGATGPWVGQAGRVALFTEAGWQFTQPLPGWQAYVMAESQMAFFNGVAWIALSDGPFVAGQLGVSATPDTTNRLSVSSPATLLNHAGSGHQLKLNKAVAADTASLLFQTGFSGRAEMGTAGSDDFSVKVSPDGSAYFTALEADAATGEVTLPMPVHLGGQAADPGTLVDGTLWLNTTTGEVKVRSAGVTLPVGGGGGGVSDGDKGDITVSGSGATWSIDAGAVSLGKLADIATDSFLGRDTAGTGAPEVLTPAQARGILNVADGATANASDASLRDRATHTGTQGAATITGLAAVATSGSASDLAAGTLPAARFDDTAHGVRAGGSLHANVIAGGAAGFMTGTDKTKLDGVATGATANSSDATLLARANHTGTQTASTISDFTETAQDAVGAMVDTTLTYVDATPLLQRAALSGAITASAGSNTTALGSFTKAQLDAAVSDGNVLYVGDVTSNATHTGDVTGATALTIAADAVTNAKLANVATGTLKGRTTAGTGDPEDLTGTQATALFDTFTSAAKGLVPASGGGTTNFLRADGTFAAPGGGGAPGGATGEVQYNNGGAFAGAADVEIEGGQLRLPAIATPTAPAASGIKVYGKALAGRIQPAFIGTSGLDSTLQPGLSGNRVLFVSPTSGTTAPSAWGGNVGVLGTASFQQTFGSTNRWLSTARKRYTTAAAAGSAASTRQAYTNWMRGGAAGFGGFFFRAQFGVNINLNGSQLFVGLCPATGALGGDPSTDFPLNMCGMGWDAADSSAGNWQFFRNDGAGSPVKVDLGATNAARAVDVGYELVMFMDPGGSELFVQITNLDTGADVLTTSYTTDIPSVNAGMCLKCDVRNGAVASACNIEWAKIYIETDY